jgi:hypothetical protein
MKKLVVLLTVALAGTLAAQQATPPSSTKPSAATTTTPAAHALATPTVLGQNEMALPVGTAIRMKLETALSTDVTKRGDRFSGRVTEAVKLNGKTIIPVGAAMEGEVFRSEDKRRIKGTPTLDLNPDTVTLPDGQKYMIRASIVDTSNRKLNVNDEGEIKGEGHDKRDLIELGIGTAAGAGVGAAIGGGKGALIGAGVGATASVVRWLTKTRTATLNPGTELIMELSRPLQLTATDGD